MNTDDSRTAGYNTDVTSCPDGSFCCGSQNTTCCDNMEGVTVGQYGRVVSSSSLSSTLSSTLSPTSNSSSRFSSSSTSSSTPSVAVAATGGGGGDTGAVVGLAVGLGAIVTAALVVFVLLFVREKRGQPARSSTMSQTILGGMGKPDVRENPVVRCPELY